MAGQDENLGNIVDPEQLTPEISTPKSLSISCSPGNKEPW
jgi:hypothetical protein